MINLAIGLQLLLLLGFNYLPSGLRLGLAATINITYVLAIIFYVQKTGHRRDLILLAPVAGYVVLGLLGLGLENISQTESRASVIAAFRQLSPYVALVALIVCRAEISRRLLVICAVTILASASLHATLFPEVFLNNSYRFAPFSTNIHASAYGLVAVALLLWFFHATGSLPHVAVYGLTAICFLLLFGNGVRSAVLFLVCYLAVEAVLSAKLLKENKGLFLVLLAALICAVTAVALTIDLTQYNHLSSGRLSNYSERFSLLYERDLRSLLLGSGPGSDLLKTNTWWWDAKDSHSDILKILWEGGILGLCVFLWFWLLIGMRDQGALLSFSIAILAVSLVSNAYLSRPNSAFLLFAFVAANQYFRESKIENAT